MDFGVLTLFDFYPGKQVEQRYFQETLDLMTEAESLGFTTAWVGEEHFYTFGICPSPQLFLTALSQRTTTMRLGTAISLLPFENPLRKAEDFAMLDVLSGGRLNFGVGRGSIPKHFQGFCIDAKESRARYEEAIEVIRTAWTSHSFHHDGRFWQVPELSLSPHPLQDPHPPIYRGTVSAASYERAGVVGDNAFVVPWTTGPHEVVADRVRLYRETLAANGHASRRTTTIFYLFIDRDGRAALREAKEIATAYSRHITGAVMTKERTSSTDPSSALFSTTDFILSIPDHIEERGVVGTPQQCIRKLRELDEEFGLDHVAFYVHPGARETKRALDGLRLFSEEVLPAFLS
jgi:alkanesulfonate monooxygenase SsuD/methylene tetrahydromethanopterin reductase-like flavin-dependent oxidoreductase (luciferase family)